MFSVVDLIFGQIWQCFFCTDIWQFLNCLQHSVNQNVLMMNQHQKKRWRRRRRKKIQEKWKKQINFLTKVIGFKKKKFEHIILLVLPSFLLKLLGFGSFVTKPFSSLLLLLLIITFQRVPMWKNFLLPIMQLRIKCNLWMNGTELFDMVRLLFSFSYLRYQWNYMFPMYVSKVKFLFYYILFLPCGNCIDKKSTG